MNWQRFCMSEPEGRYDLSKPFALGGWRYATNAIIAISTRTKLRNTRGKYPPELGAMFDKAPWSFCLKPLPRPHTDRVQETDECHCLNLNGDGAVVPDPVCEKCGGEGWYPYDVHVWNRFDGLIVDGKYLEIIHEELSSPLYGPRFDEKFIPIVAGDYQLLLAPIKDKPHSPFVRPIRDVDAVQAVKASDGSHE